MAVWRDTVVVHFPERSPLLTDPAYAEYVAKNIVRLD